MARSSMGFGLAIGMSQGSRPLVTPDTSTSTRLRPPVPIWRRHDDEPAPAPTPSWAERITRASRPGRTSAGPTVRRSVKTAPTQAEFVSSGDRKLDALRRMLQAGPADSAPVRNPNAAPLPANDPTIRRSAAPAASTAPAAIPERAIGRRGDTMSGPGTAPGEIGRRFQPETAGSSDIKAVLPDAPMSTRGSKSASKAPPNRDRNTDRSTDAFERMLRSRGLIGAAPGDNDQAGPRPQPTINPATRDSSRTQDSNPSGRRSPQPSGAPTTSRSPAAPMVRRSPSGRVAPRHSPESSRPPQQRGADTRPAQSRPDPASGLSTDPLDASAALDPVQTVDPSQPADRPQLVQRQSIATATRPISITEPLPMVEPFRATNRPDETAAEQTDRFDEMVAPPAGRVISTESTTMAATTAPAIAVRARRTRTGRLRSSPGHALAGLANRSLLPHTQSDARRPMSAIARSVAMSETTTPPPRDSDRTTPGSLVDPVRTAPRRVASIKADRSGRPGPTLARSFDGAEAALTALTDVDQAPVRPAPASSDSAHQPLRSTDMRSGDASGPNQSVAPRAELHSISAGRQAVPSPAIDYDVTAAFDERPDSGQMRLARPGRLGRFAGDDHTPVGLQRHSVVGPGPGALQRVLAEMSASKLFTSGRVVEPAGTGRPGRTPTTSVIRSGTVAPLTVAIEATARSGAATAAVTARRQLDPSVTTPAPDAARDTARLPAAAPAAPDTARLPAGAPAAPPSPSQVVPPAKPGHPVQRTAAPTVAPGTSTDRRRPAGDSQRVQRPSSDDRPATAPDHIIRRRTESDRGATDQAAAVADTTDRPAPPAASLGDRFLHELSRQPSPRPQPLPERYRPMAQAITGHHRVMLSVNDASRRALRSVGKVAATTDNVIHLDKPLAPGRQASEVMAHELTHVAHPSSAPRFFDDDDHSPEERQAEQVAKVMARAPLAPSGTISRGRGAPSTPTISRSRSGSGPDVVRRSPARNSGPGALSASALADQLMVGRTGQRNAQSDVVRRSPAPEQSTIQRFAEGSQSSPQSETIDSFSPGQQQDDFQDFRDHLDQHFEYLLRRLERRMVIELERRGGRFWRGV